MERSISTMLTRTADGAMLVNEDSYVILWNRAAERLLGFQAGEVLGRPCHEVIRGETLTGHPLFPLLRRRSRLGCGSGIRNFDIQTHTKAGKVIWLNVGFLPVPSRKKDWFLFAHLFRDITKRMRILGLAEELHTLLATPWAATPSQTPRGAGASEAPLARCLTSPRRFLSVNGSEKSCDCWPGEDLQGEDKNRGLGEVFLGGMKEWQQSAFVKLYRVEMGGAKQPWFFILLRRIPPP